MGHAGMEEIPGGHSMTTVEPGRYRHYKGKEYTVLGVALHSETQEELVVHRQEYGDHGLWVRPKQMFLETATTALSRTYRRIESKESEMAKKSKTPPPFEGRWRIVSMSAWDEDYINEEEEGYFEFDDRGGGQFHFGYVHGDMDCRLTTRDGEPAVEWTWDGNDEMDPAQGRGWAVVKGDELHGMIFFHSAGDDSEFVATRAKEKKAPKRK